jgi:hypothetical protein
MTRHWGGRPAQDGPREFTIRTSIGRLRIAECGLCGALVVLDDGQLQHIRHHSATDTLGVPDGWPDPNPPTEPTGRESAR